LSPQHGASEKLKSKFEKQSILEVNSHYGETRARRHISESAWSDELLLYRDYTQVFSVESHRPK
jgi:hypothetical protein